ncbi:MAG: iron-containing alcohol dehydrogenase [Deltaproteobacteria bacterium]|jgi:alcohol dehydrogenase|nr:iron-containing alcohol dehydrogenase [Deltaproteobacteria bacterium]
MEVRKFSIPEIIFGRGSLQYAGLCARRLGAEKVLLVSDRGLEEAGWVDRVVEILDHEKLHWIYYGDIISNPRDFQIDKGVGFYHRHKADVIIGLGGGSPMDAAKGIALVASNGGRIQDYEGANRIHQPLPPMIFIPSTAGSGSDISQFAIITDVERRVKMSIISRTLVPNISIIDPLLLQTKSRKLIVAAAIDALCHAIESYVSTIASPFTEIQSLKAMQLIMKNLKRATETRDLNSLEQLSAASTAAGMAFSNAGLGVEHAIAHSLGGIFDTLHGLVHPVLLPPVMRFNLPACAQKMAQVGEILLGKKRRGAQATALGGIEKLEEFCDTMGVQTRLRDIVNEHAKLPDMCRMAVNDACLLTNPRQATWEDLLQICEEAW